MEERLQQFLDTSHLTSDIVNTSTQSPSVVRSPCEGGSPVVGGGSLRFIHHQVLELARDCLQKSSAKLLSAPYFHEMSENLTRLIQDVRMLSVESSLLSLSYIYTYYHCYVECTVIY